MSEFKNLNGYDVKDEVARNGLSTLQNYVDNQVESAVDEINELKEVLTITSEMITSDLYLSTTIGTSQNTIEIDISSLNQEYKYLKMEEFANDYGIVKIPIEKGKKSIVNIPMYGTWVSGNTINYISGIAQLILEVQTNKIVVSCNSINMGSKNSSNALMNPTHLVSTVNAGGYLGFRNLEFTNL